MNQASSEVNGTVLLVLAHKVVSAMGGDAGTCERPGRIRLQLARGIVPQLGRCRRLTYNTPVPDQVLGATEVNVRPDFASLIERLGLTTRLIGFYDAPETQPFAPLVTPDPDACVFSAYDKWMKGQTLLLTPRNCGCSGAGRWLCGGAGGSREEMVDFLVQEEGIKASKELMNHWLDGQQGHQPEHPNLLIGPLRRDQYRHLRSVTFYVNPDQLGMLVMGAHYHSAPGDPPPVIVPFGMGCMQLAALFESLEVPQAIVGAIDVTVRGSFPQDILAFTVTKPMFERLCALDGASFLNKPFVDDLQKARQERVRAGTLQH